MEIVKRISRRLIAQVGEAEATPKGYGLIYYDFCRAVVLVAPIPLNLILRFGYLIYGHLTVCLYPIGFERRLQRAREVGKKYGYSSGVEDGKNATMKVVGDVLGHISKYQAKQ